MEEPSVSVTKLGTTEKDATGPEVPQFVVNLDLPPRERWNAVIDANLDVKKP
jgi:hypothetical protein